jgi:acyl carrier protein
MATAEEKASESTEERVRAVIGRVTKLEAGFSATSDLFRDLGVKSIAALDLLLSLEEEFSIAIPDDKFGDARSVEKLVTLVAELGA